MPQINNFIVLFYEDEHGKKPAKNFLLGLDKSFLAKFTSVITILQEKGSLMREPYSKSLGDGIFELHVNYGNNIARVLYFFCYGRQIILTNGFIKKTQKTPARQINLAKKYRKDYMERNKANANI